MRGEGRWLFAGEFSVEATESDAECLYGTHRVTVVHSEHIFRYPAKLHQDVVNCNQQQTASRCSQL